MTSRRGPASSLMPVAYLLAAVGLVFLALPSTLRPRQQQPNESAALSPDEPPDGHVVITEVGRGRSATAGAGPVAAPNDGGIGEGPPAKTAPRFCPKGFGNPPRQAESPYAAPCAAGFAGPNGGATSRNVFAGEIRISINASAAPKDGPVSVQPVQGESAEDRTYRVLQKWFNDTFQTYGRTLRFYGAKTDALDEAKTRATVLRAINEYKVFAGVGTSAIGCQEFERAKLPSFCPQMALSDFQRADPYLWSWYMDGTKMAAFTAEYACKKLAGKPPIFNERRDATFDYTKPRVFGIAYYDDPGVTPNAFLLQRLLKESCGIEVATMAGYSLVGREGQSNYAQTTVKLRAAGVTTVVPLNDFITLAGLTNAAESSAYFPEWYTNGYGAMDRNQLGQLMNPDQWRHAFGFTTGDVERLFVDTECYKAYVSVDPDNAPHYGVCTYTFPLLIQAASGIQQAGPRLTPDAFRKGLWSMGYRYYDKPAWAIGGGYGPGDWTYMDTIAEFWWDAAATDPQEGKPGAYRYVRTGKRYKLGELPREDPLVFRDGVTVVDES